MMATKINSYLFLLICASLLASCGNYEEFNESSLSGFSGVTPIESLSFSSVFEEVISGKCLKCHQGYSDYNTVKSKAQQMVRMIRNDQMPKNGTPLNERERNIFFSWVSAGSPLGNRDDSPDVVELAPNWESLSKNIFFQKCTICHNPDGDVPWVNFTTRNAVFEQRDLLVNFDTPEDSYLIEVVSDPDEPMPPIDSPFERLTQQEIETLKEWIRLGLP